MGMDYKYAGSASYPRFSEELKAVISLFGMEPAGYKSPIYSEFEFYVEKNYSFPKDIPDVFIHWANDPYYDFTEKETKELYEFMCPKWDSIKEASDQIASELETLISNNEGWSIW